MRLIKKCLKWLFYLISIPVLYVVISIILSFITVNNAEHIGADNEVYLGTNGIHLEIIIPLEVMDNALQKGLKFFTKDEYLSFGWGDKNFYLNTPTWGDLTIRNAFNATFLKSDTLIHLTRYKTKQTDWTVVKLTDEQLKKLNQYILNYFKKDQNGNKIILEGQGYSRYDDFYEAHGNYSCFKTCNSWVNSGLKESDLKACFWTPFDFAVLNKYKK